MNSVYIFIFFLFACIAGLKTKEQHSKEDLGKSGFCHDYSMSSFKDRTSDIRVDLVFHEEILNEIHVPKESIHNN